MSSTRSGPRRKGRKTIPDAARLAVWVRSGGRCAICNQYLLDGSMTYREVSLGQLAHIVGQQETPGSPRGLADLIGQNRDTPENLMLVCGDEHPEIDDRTTLDVFAVELLRDLKRRHEDRIHHVTGIVDDHSTTVIRMLAPVRGREVELSRQTAAMTVIRGAHRFARFLESYHRHGIEIDLRQLPGEADAGPDYYGAATARIDSVVRRLNEGTAQDAVTHLSVFAFARVPLLVYLGARLDDTVPTDIYQRHRIDETWLWDETDRATKFEVTTPEKPGGMVGHDAVLVLNISGTIQPDEIPADLGHLPRYVMTSVGTVPNPNIMRARSTLDAFESAVRALFSTLEARDKTMNRLHVLPAIPISAAVTLGRARDPQVHPAMVIYDRTDTGYQTALEIT